jgi:hypothetical protein
MILGGVTNNTTTAKMETLNSIEIFNIKKGKSYIFGTLDNAVQNHVGINFNGTLMYCGGYSAIGASPEKGCFKYDQSWKKVKMQTFGVAASTILIEHIYKILRNQN